jgi:hypothetical protein
MPSSSRGVKWEEADAIARWLGGQLAREGLVDSPEQVALPDFNRLNSMCRRAGQAAPLDLQKGGFEWLRSTGPDREKAGTNLPAVFVERKSLGGNVILRPLGANKRKDAHPFRIIMPAGEKHQIHPGRAQSATPEKSS